MKKICQDDEVIVLAGKDRSKTGHVQKILSNGRAIVVGINKVKHHVKPNLELNRKGGIEEREAPIHLSNLAIFNPKTKKAERIGVKIIQSKDATTTNAKHNKIRVYKSSGENVPVTRATSVSDKNVKKDAKPKKAQTKKKK